jgi:hypothetical protein
MDLSALAALLVQYPPRRLTGHALAVRGQIFGSFDRTDICPPGFFVGQMSGAGFDADKCLIA